MGMELMFDEAKESTCSFQEQLLLRCLFWVRVKVILCWMISFSVTQGCKEQLKISGGLTFILLIVDL